MPKKRGTKPKPTAILKLHGTHRDDRRYGDEPQPPAKVPDRPKFLKREAKKKWEKLAPLLAAQKCLTEWDEDMFAAYCQLYGQFVEITRKLKKVYIQTTVSGDTNVAALLSAQIKVLKQMTSIATEFGLTPSSRTRISTGGQPQEDQFDAILKRSKNAG